MCCTVIEVKVTGSAIPPPPSDTDSDTLTTHPALLADEHLCSGFKGGVPAMVRKQEECRPSFTDGDAISAGAVGGYKVILQLQPAPDGSWGIVICWQKPGCVTLNSGCYPETKSMWRAWLCEKVAVISEPPAYQMPPIAPSRSGLPTLFQPASYFSDAQVNMIYL